MVQAVVRWKFAAEITENISKTKIKDILLRDREKTNCWKCKWISGYSGQELKERKIFQRE
jgi:hypothetical protein